MAKKFNIAGRCIPSRHYMADTSRKQKAILTMVEEGDYFVINRPRQYGKTTTLHNIADGLVESGEYLVLFLKALQNSRFCKAFPFFLLFSKLKT